MRGLSFRRGSASDLPHLKKLWKLAFDDDDAFIELFYNRLFDGARVYLAEARGALASMVHLLDIGGISHRAALSPLPCSCVYAFATHPDFRGNRIGSDLLSFALEAERASGTAAVIVRPAYPELFSYYWQNFGFKPFFTVKETEYVLPENTLSPVALFAADIDEYLAFRKNILAKTAHLIPSIEVAGFQRESCKLSGGGFCFIAIDGVNVGCAMFECEEDGVLFIPELIVPGKHFDSAVSALLRENGARRALVRSPSIDGGKPFAMLKHWGGNSLPGNLTVYMGFALD